MQQSKDFLITIIVTAVLTIIIFMFGMFTGKKISEMKIQEEIEKNFPNSESLKDKINDFRYME